MSVGYAGTCYLVHLFIYIVDASLSVLVCYIVSRIAAATTRKEASEIGRTPDQNSDDQKKNEARHALTWTVTLKSGFPNVWVGKNRSSF